MNSKLREKVIKLRINEELSYTQIQRRFSIPKSTLSYWLKDFPLSKQRISVLNAQGRKKSEAKVERFRRAMQVKREKEEDEAYKRYVKKFEEIAKSEIIFFVAGLMLYLGEGDKKNKNRVNLANTDSEVIKFFIKWAVCFFDISKKDIRVQLHLYEDMEIIKERDFWKKELGLLSSQFYKIQIRKLRRNSFSYKGGARHGTCSVYILSTRIKMEIMMAVRAFLKSYN